MNSVGFNPDFPVGSTRRLSGAPNLAAASRPKRAGDQLDLDQGNSRSAGASDDCVWIVSVHVLLRNGFLIRNQRSGMRRAPSRRMTSPFSIVFSQMRRTKAANSDGRPRREGNCTLLPRASCTSCGMPAIINAYRTRGARTCRQLCNRHERELSRAPFPSSASLDRVSRKRSRPCENAMLHLRGRKFFLLTELCGLDQRLSSRGLAFLRRVLRLRSQSACFHIVWVVFRTHPALSCPRFLWTPYCSEKLEDRQHER